MSNTAKEALKFHICMEKWKKKKIHEFIFHFLNTVTTETTKINTGLYWCDATSEQCKINSSTHNTNLANDMSNDHVDFNAL